MQLKIVTENQSFGAKHWHLHEVLVFLEMSKINGCGCFQAFLVKIWDSKDSRKVQVIFLYFSYKESFKPLPENVNDSEKEAF